jgi:hypothetical protein
MVFRHNASILVIAAFLTSPLAWGAQNVLFNGSMESGEGPQGLDPMIPADWTLQGAVVERSAEANLVPAGEGHALKAFASEPVEMAYQDVAINEGDTVIISASLYTRSDDKLSGDALAGIYLEFRDADEDFISLEYLFVLNNGSPANVWIPGTIETTAPAGAVTARFKCVWVWYGTAGGSAYWDDCSLTVNGGLNQLLNSDFEQAGPGEQSPTGIDDWMGFNDQEQSSDVAVHGEKSLKVGTDDPYSGLFQDMGVFDDGDRILLKAKVFSPSTNGLTNSARAGIKLEFYPADGGPTLPDPTENLAFDKDSPTDSWELVDLGTTGLVVPDEASLARIVLIYFVPDGQASTNGAVYFDAAYAEVSSAPGTNQLLNPSFEDGQGGENGIDDWTEFGSGTGEAQKSNFEVPGYPDEFYESSMKATGDATAGIQQEIAVTPGDVLSASVFMRMRSDNPLLLNTRAGIKVEWVAEGGTVPPPVDITETPSSNTITAASPKDTWIDLSIDFTMPAGTHAIPRFVNIVARGATGTGTAYFDACEAIVLNVFDGADADGDNDQDLFDIGEFQRCYSGDGVTPLKWNCTVFDNDDDEDIDLTDFGFFVPRITGP